MHMPKQKKYVHIDVPKHLLPIIDAITKAVRAAKKNENDCYFCSQEPVATDLATLFELIGAMLDCLEYHVEKCIEVPIIDLLILDSFVLDVIMEQNEWVVEKVLENKVIKREFEDYYYEMVDRVNLRFSDRNIKIYCEQEVESLSYKFYKKGMHLFKGNGYLNLLFWLLYRRNESDRFFKIFKRIENKNGYINKLGLLFTKRSECLVEGNTVLAAIKKAGEPLPFRIPTCCDQHDFNSIFNDKNKTEIEIKTVNFEENRKEKVFENEIIEKLKFTNIKVLDEKCKAYKKLMILFKEIVTENITDFKELQMWYEIQAELAEWDDCVEKWAKDRDDGEGNVDSAMIDKCADFRKYEQGWLIFIDEKTIKKSTVPNAAYLCVKALKYTGNDIWTSRLSVALGIAACIGEKKIFCKITNFIIPLIYNLSEGKRFSVMKNMMECAKSFKECEEVLFYMLKGLYALCRKCKSNGTCVMCAKYANEIYSYWKIKKEKNSFLFFYRRGEWDCRICCNMLHVCAETEHAEFYNVCQDLLNLGIEIDTNICNTLEEHHNYIHKGCNVVHPTMEPAKMGKILINHFLKERRSINK